MQVKTTDHFAKVHSHIHRMICVNKAYMGVFYDFPRLILPCAHSLHAYFPQMSSAFCHQKNDSSTVNPRGYAEIMIMGLSDTTGRCEP